MNNVKKPFMFGFRFLVNRDQWLQNVVSHSIPPFTLTIPLWLVTLGMIGYGILFPEQNPGFNPGLMLGVNVACVVLLGVVYGVFFYTHCLIVDRAEWRKMKMFEDMVHSDI